MLKVKSVDKNCSILDAILNYYSYVGYANLKLQFSKLRRNMRFLLNITYQTYLHTSRF